MLRNKLIMIIISASLFAGEVDSLYAVGRVIDDSSQLVNTYLNEEIRKKIDNLPEYLQRDQCEQVALYLMEELGSTDYFFFRTGALNTPLELWVKENQIIDRIPSTIEYQEVFAPKSIFAPELKLFNLYPKKIDPVINIAGISVGTDKLSHFIGGGYEYYRRYLEVCQSAGTEEDAEYSIINWGIEMESSILGFWSVGIFSYSDLEANYQGYLFARDLCGKKILRHHRDGWRQEKFIDIRLYVNPNWDEVYNHNSYTPIRREEIQRNIHYLDICKKLNWQALQTRYRGYGDTYGFQEIGNRIDTGLSSVLLEVLREKGKHQQYLYDNISEKYGLTKSYDDFIAFFQERQEYYKVYSFESFCSEAYSQDGNFSANNPSLQTLKKGLSSE